MLPRKSKRLLTGGLLGLVMSLCSLTAYGQVHVVHHAVHVAPHTVVVHGPCCYRSYRYHPYHSYHVYHPYHVYHVYHAYHVYHSYPVYHPCCAHYESHDYIAHERESGYHDGFDRGKDDAEDCRALDPYHSHHYTHSHS